MKKPRRLKLSRETLLRLDEPELRKVVQGGALTVNLVCLSPWCAPTVAATCHC